MRARVQADPDAAGAPEPDGNALVVVGDAGGARAALETLCFVPPLRVAQVARPAWPDRGNEEMPLLFLLGRCAALADTRAIAGWFDRLEATDGPPVALALPRQEAGWCTLAAHPQCCGLLPVEPLFGITEIEQVVTAARRARTRRWRRERTPTGRLAWSFSSVDAADAGRIWLLLTSVLADLRGLDEELPRLGMAFTEALTNAVEHGNLELASSLKNEDDGMNRFFAERERRLADPRFAARRVRVELQISPEHLQIRLRNQGPGFRPDEESRIRFDLPRHTHPYGLGLRMIEGLVDEVEIAPDGRGITLRSRLSPRPHRRAA